MSTDAGARQSLGGLVRRGLRLSLLNTIIGRTGTLITGIVLARLLLPADFGVFAVALVALNALLAINELGVSLALVRWPGDPREIAPTVTTISMASSALLYAVCFTAAPVFSAALGAPEATWVVRLLCLSVLIDGVTAAAAQFVNRDFRQGVRLLVDLSNLLLTTGVTVYLAVDGHGAWSLAWGRLVGNGLSALLLFRLAALWPRPGFDRRHAGELVRFGLPLAGASLLVFGMLNIDYLVTGPLLGAVALGFYLQAFNLASWPVNMFSAVVRRVSLAAFSRVQDDADGRQRVLAGLATLLAGAVLPVCALLGLLALPLVGTLYGQRWTPSAAALQFLAITAVVRVAAELSYDFLVALDRPRTTLWLQAGWVLALLAALPVGALTGGLAGVAAASAVVASTVVLPSYALALRSCGVSLARLGAALVRPVVGCACLVAAVLVVRWFTEPSALQLLLGGTVGMLAYLPAVWPLRHRLRALRS